MKAARIKGPSNIKVEEVPIKEPKENEVLIEIKAAGLCGTDYDLYKNDMIYIKGGITKLPLIPGHEWSGIIKKKGNQVKDYKVGDKVVGECTINCGRCIYCQNGKYNQCLERKETGIFGLDGGFAEYITFPAFGLHKFENISFEEASLVEPAAIALYSILRSNISPLNNVMVTGPGPIGLIVAQLLKKIYNVKQLILTGTRDERLNIAKKFNVNGTINIKKENVQNKVKKLTGNEMIDIVIETSGGKTVFNDIQKVINPCGEVVLVGFFGHKSPKIDLDFFITNEINLISSLGSPGVWDQVIFLMENNKIDVNPIISHIMKLQEIEKAIDFMVNRKDNALKILIAP